MLAVNTSVSTVGTVLADVVFPIPVSAAPGEFAVELVMAISASVVVVVSNIVVLEGSETVATFPSRTFLVGRTAIFGVEGRLWRESLVSMGTSGETLPGSDSSSDKSKKVLVSA